jgi:hypothetical protein
MRSGTGKRWWRKPTRLHHRHEPGDPLIESYFDVGLCGFLNCLPAGLPCRLFSAGSGHAPASQGLASSGAIGRTLRPVPTAGRGRNVLRPSVLVEINGVAAVAPLPLRGILVFGMVGVPGECGHRHRRRGRSRHECLPPARPALPRLGSLNWKCTSAMQFFSKMLISDVLEAALIPKDLL